MERKEAMEIARKLYNKSLFLKKDKEAMVTLIPELAESEGGIKDEMIRKAVISTFKPHCNFYEVSVDEVLAWFEKRISKSRQKDIDEAYLKGVCDAKHKLEEQGEQKPINIVTILDDYFANTPKEQQEIDWEELKHLNNFGWKLVEQKPTEWSEEDKERYISCLQRLSTGNPEQPETINSKWFKEHVYPQSRWKPSATDIQVLEYVIDRGANPIDYHATLHGILEQLKKLREE